MQPLLLRALREGQTKGASQELLEVLRESRESLDVERQAEESRNEIKPHGAWPKGTVISQSRHGRAAELSRQWRQWQWRFLRAVSKNRMARNAWRQFARAGDQKRALKHEALWLLYRYHCATLAIPKGKDSAAKSNVRAASRKDRNLASSVTRRHQADALARIFPLEPYASRNLTMADVEQRFADANAPRSIERVFKASTRKKAGIALLASLVAEAKWCGVSLGADRIFALAECAAPGHFIPYKGGEKDSTLRRILRDAKSCRNRNELLAWIYG